MIELIVFCILVLAAGYWTAMYVMGRRDDVIHGKFVQSDDEEAFAQVAMPAPSPPFPKRPVKAGNELAANAAAAAPVNSAALQSLLAAIQQDLKSVA